MQEEELLVEPEEILDIRYDEDGHLELLIQWRHLPTHETSWLRAEELK